MDKTELRRRIREKKRAMTAEEIEERSRELGRQFAATEAYRRAKTVYGYMPYNQEVRTVPMLEQALRDGKKVAVPKCYGDEMKFIYLDDLTKVAKGYAGIPEPIADEPVAHDETALVLMPGLAFDPQGHRIGYGGGFYDNIPRVLPSQVEARINFGSWQLPPVFHWLKNAGELSWPEILQIFNGGIGYVLILPAEQAEEAINRIQAFNLRAWRIGEIARRAQDGEQVVVNF